MRKLVEVDKVPVMQTIYTFIVFAQMPVAEETKTVVFCPVGRASRADDP